MSPRDRSDLPPDEEQVFEPAAGPAIPLAPRAPAPGDHVSFEDFWRELGLPATDENARLKELFYEWLGQNGYDVHRRDEPTILGDVAGWRHAWTRYLKRRRLT